MPRAVNTAHEALSVAGCSFLEIFSIRASSSDCALHSVQIHHGWVPARQPVSCFFRNPTFYVLMLFLFLFSEITVSPNPDTRSRSTDCLQSLVILTVLSHFLVRMSVDICRPWLQFQHKDFLFIGSTFVRLDIAVLVLFTDSRPVSGKNIAAPLISVMNMRLRRLSLTFSL